MNINRDKHNKYVAGWTPNITTSTGSETSSGSTTSTIIYVGGGGSSSGGDSGTVTQQNTFMYYVMSDGTNSITQTATIPTDTAILTLIGKNGVTVTASQEKSIPETEFVSTGTNTGTYKISYNKLVTTPDPTEEVPEPQPITTYPVTITYVSGDKILTSSFDTLTLYNTVDETEQVVATYNQTQLEIDGDTTGINSIVADANNTVFSRITLSITVEEQTTIILDFAVTVNQQDILYVEGTQTEQYWKLDDDGNLYTTYNAYSTQELSAYGMGESEGTPTTGAEYLYQLKDVSDAVQTPIDKGILQYNAATSQWEVTDGSNITPDLTGYAKEDWVTQQITNQINILKGNAPENMDTLGEIAGVISSLSDKVTSLEVLLEWFEWDDTNDAIKALFDLYGVGEISAYGYNTQEQPSGAQYLNDLLDVTISNPTNNQILIYNGSQWVNSTLPESGLNESELAQYLTEHNYVQSSALQQYATITQLNQEITNLIGGAPAELDTLGEIATVIQSLQQLLDWFSFVDGKIRANYDLWGVGEISAYGVGEGSSSGGKNYLHELEDVLLGDDLASGQLLQYNGTYWVNIDKDEVGLNETELANYLTQNNYLQQGDVTWSNLSGKPSTFNTTINQINDLNSNWDSLLLNSPTDYVTRWPAFSEVTNKPTTLAGYGITDAYTKTETDDRYVNITGDTMTGNLTLPALIANDYIRIGSTARLEYDSTNNAIKVTNASGGIVNFYATGEVSAYGAGSGSTISGYLNDLQDVTISNVTTGQALIYNGSQWVNQTIQQGLDESALEDYLNDNGYLPSDAVANKGVAGKLAYYVNATTIDDYTSTVGSNTKFMYLNAGVPTASNGTVGNTLTPVYLNAGTFTTSDRYRVRGLSGVYTGNGGIEYPSYFTDYGLAVNMMNLPVQYSDVIYINGYNNGGADVPYINAIAFQKTSNTHGQVYHCRAGYGDSSWGTWYVFLDSYNYDNYTVTKTGGGASGTWGIGITGNAASATKLQTARTIWGKPFDGTESVSGDLRNVGSIVPLSGYYDLGTSSNYWNYIWAYRLNLINNGTNYICSGNGDNATYNTYNIKIHSNWGIGITGNEDICRLVIDARTGGITMRGALSVGSYVQIGSARLIWDSTNNALYVQKSDGSVCNFYSTGEVSAYGIGSETIISGDLTDIDSLTFTPGTNNRNLYLNANGIRIITTSSSGWGTGITVYNSANTTKLGDVCGAYGGQNQFTYSYFGGPYNSPGMTILANKNVGIGTTNPTYKLHVSGTAYATGGFQNGSDIRYKDIVQDILLSITDIANAPSFTFTWKDDQTKQVQCGTSAQYWQKILPQVIMSTNDQLSMSYDKAALLSVISVAKEVETLEQRVSKLERENATLKQKLGDNNKIRTN